MLPLPQLDDRSYEQIRDEAIENIVKHCPQWTNHNASDPGITLIELFSSMTEMLQYRLNRVPQKNYLAFLDMLGITGRLPTPARSRIKFKLSDGFELGENKKSMINVPVNTTITTDSDDDPIVFETNKETKLSNLKIKNIFSYVFDTESKRHTVIEHLEDMHSGKGFIPFEATKVSSNHTNIYIYSDALEALNDKSLVSVVFRIPPVIPGFNYESESNFLKRLDWQYYNGEEWKQLSVSDDSIDIKDFDSGDAKLLVVSFDGNLDDFQKAPVVELGKKERYYIRAHLRESKSWFSDFEVFEISVSTKSRLEGIVPDGCSYRDMPLDLNSSFAPFGLRPKNDDFYKNDEIFYIKSREAFSKKGAKVSIDIKHSQNREYKMPNLTTDLTLGYYYFSDKSDEWKKLKLDDGTNNFTKNGKLEFEVPKDMAESDVNGDLSYKIKVKIESGDYGKEEEKEFREGQEVTISASTLNPPVFSRMVIYYAQDRADLDECVVYNNYEYETKSLKKKSKIVKLFDQKDNHDISLNICFDSLIENNYIDLYFDIDEHIIDKRNMKSDERDLQWEICANKKWIKIKVDDDTDSLTCSGDIRLYIDKTEFSKISLNAKDVEGMWVRAKVINSALSQIPKINSIILNSVEIVQKKSFYNEFIGKSVGIPSMSFELNNKNIVAPPKIVCADEEFNYTKRFIEHSSEDKVFRFDGINGRVEFGDGKYGDIPSANLDIYAKEYAITLGSKGNIPKDSITVLQNSINYVESVTNISNAIGGSDGDGFNELVKYAPSIFKTRDRAITTEDYESLAKEFSSNIINAKAVSKNGDVVVVIVTKDMVNKGGFINRKLIEELTAYLKSKSLVTVLPVVKSPNVVTLNVKVKIKTTSEKSELSSNDIEERLSQEAKRYFSIVNGGDDGNGYPMGKNITRADLYKLLNKVDSTLYFEEVNLNNKNNKVKLSYNSIVRFESLAVEELSYDF
jgi:hypothetical protein